MPFTKGMYSTTVRMALVTAESFAVMVQWYEASTWVAGAPLPHCFLHSRSGLPTDNAGCLSASASEPRRTVLAVCARPRLPTLRNALFRYPPPNHQSPQPVDKAKLRQTQHQFSQADSRFHRSVYRSKFDCSMQSTPSQSASRVRTSLAYSPSSLWGRVPDRSFSPVTDHSIATNTRWAAAANNVWTFHIH